MLEVYHLIRSQSERVVWLCEELGIDYKLHVHERNPETALAPPIFKELHTPGTAPVIVDTTPNGKRVVIGESGACVEYIVNVYGGGRFTVKPGAENYADYVSWLHFVNGSYQSASSRNLSLNLATGGNIVESPIIKMMMGRVDMYRQMIEKRLGEAPYLAGDDVTAADFMMMWSLSTGRGWVPVDLTPHPNILAYLERISQRPGYKSARQKGDSQDAPLIGPIVERFKYGALK